MTTEATSSMDEQTVATRTEILRQAHDLFCHYGFKKTNIGDIARCCGMSPGNLYRFFRNKQAIGLAAVEQFFRQSETVMESVLLVPGGTAEERLRGLMTAGIGHILDELDRNPRMVELAEFLCEPDNAEGWELLNTHLAWRRARVIAEIERGIANGEFAPCDTEATAIAFGNALKVFWMPVTLASWRDPQTIRPELKAVLELVFRGLRA